ncbi:MAG: DUF2061 domain-containing protein [Stygiobacter sp.]
MHDKHYRSIIKSLTWRLTGSIDTTIISYLLTGDYKIALSIGGIEIFTKIILYYLHERIWNKIKFGKEQKSEPEYHI